jgi:hypothetical protein
MSSDNENTLFGSEPRPTVTIPGRRGAPRRPLPPGPLTLSPAPLPLAGRDRVGWRVVSLLLCLDSCRGKSATVEQLHVLSWAVRDEDNATQLLAAWQGSPDAPRLMRALDPMLEDTLRLSHAAQLVEQRSSGRQALSTRGKALITALRNDSQNPLSEERRALTLLGTITESGMWDRLGRRLTGNTPQKGLTT